MPLQHLRSSTAHKRPVPGNMSDGQLGINTNTGSPGLFFKDSNNTLVKVGPVHVGTTAPNASPASGGTAGNSVGEQWLDTSGGTYVFKVWDGSAWRSETGTFVDVNGDVMTGALGIIAGSASAPGLYFSGDANTGLFSAGADELALSTGGTGRLFVDSSGNIGIGNSNQTSYNAAADNLVIGSSGSNGMTIVSAPTGAGYLMFADGTTGQQTYEGQITYDHASDYFALNTNGGERLRITSDGKAGLGNSIPSSYNSAANDLVIGGHTGSNGMTICSQNNASGYIMFADGTSGSELYAGQITYDHANNRMTFGTTDGTTGLTIDSSQRVGVCTTSPAVACDVVGQVRASTGILFGSDTAAANALNDYEEGTFTPTIVGTTGAGTGTYTNQIGRYTKIGDRVTFTIYLNWTAHTGTGNIRVSNLPFTSTSATGSFHAVSIYADGIPFTGPWLQAYVGVNSTNIGMGQMTAAGVVSGIPMDSAGDITITGHYEV